VDGKRDVRQLQRHQAAGAPRIHEALCGGVDLDHDGRRRGQNRRAVRKKESERDGQQPHEAKS